VTARKQTTRSRSADQVTWQRFKRSTSTTVTAYHPAEPHVSCQSFNGTFKSYANFLVVRNTVLKVVPAIMFVFCKGIFCRISTLADSIMFWEKFVLPQNAV